MFNLKILHLNNLINFMKNTLFILLFLFTGYLAIGQNSIPGKVTDQSGESLPGVNILKVGTSEGAVSDLDGNFKLTANPEDRLRFSFIGYKTYEVRVGEQTSLNIKLMDDVSALNEVIVVGYGSTTQKELTGAVAKINSEEIMQRQVPRVDQALQGAVAGVTISTNSGSPGGTSNIRIRGLSTSGDNSPLIIVDGIIYDQAGLNALNPNDIESVNVLKDATAGIYGVRAANGVVIIETKKGKLNAKPRFSFDGYYGVQQTANKLDLLNARQYAIIKNEAFAANNQALPFANTELGQGTDWQDEVFQQAPIQNYNFSMSGGSEKTSYDIGGSYFGQQGIVGGDKANFERYNARLNFITDLSPKLKLTNVLLFTHEINSRLPENGIGSVLFNAVNAYPTEPVRVDGRFSYLDRVNDIINPVAQIQNTFNETLVNKIAGKQEIAYEIDNHFTLNGRLGYNYALVDGTTFNPLVWYGQGKFANSAANEDLDPVIVQVGEEEGGIQLERGANVNEFRNSFLDYVTEGFLNYNRTFSDNHTVKGTLGVSFNETSNRFLNATGFNVPNNSLDFASVGANQAVNGFLNNAGSSQDVQRLVSQFVRAEYDYKKRYLVSGILRRDGSTRFGANNRFGYFGSLSGAWVISDESFYNVLAIDFLKLRASFGSVGNDRIPNFAYRGTLGGQAEYVFDDLILQGVAIGRASNPDLKWETTVQTNIGLDASLFKSIDVGLNYFIKNTNDLLFSPAVSAIIGTYGAGGFPPVINGGDVRNTGVELDLNYTYQNASDFQFSVNYNITYLQNEVLRVPEGIGFLPGAGFGVGGVNATRFQAGFPIGYFIGFETDGIFQNQAEIDASEVVQAGARPGDLRFVDQNGDGSISFNDDADRTMIGSPIPDFTMGLNLNASYKGFDISANIYAALGQEIIRNYERQQPFANQSAYVFDRWIGEGTSNTVPRVTTGQTRNTVFSDFYVEDGSFARLRNVQIGYTLPNTLTEKAGISNFRIYASALNLFTLTNYMGFDPDVGAGNPIFAGVDNGIYPQARTIMGGFSLNF